MIWKGLFVIIALTLLIAPVEALAQSTVENAGDGGSGSFFDKVLFSVDAGISMPMGDISDFYNTGFVIGVNGFYPWSERLHFGGRIAYNKWGIDDGGWTGSDVDGGSSMMEFMPMARYLFPNKDASSTTFFAQGGLGFYRFSFDVDVTAGGITENYDDSDINMGLCLGGGVILERGSRELIVQPMLNQVFTDGDSSTYISITVGMAF
ncbi:MAG: hypothetical protein JW814_01200 [Candidatus Krumholzibacteriota bacterium]|nr:hypothetical protein [Candidatus Krumholzibacteriota bacterium]